MRRSHTDESVADQHGKVTRVHPYVALRRKDAM